MTNRRPFKLTKGGWIFILYTIGVGAGAINTGNNLLYLLFGVFLGLILASGVLSDLDLWGVRVNWAFPDAFEAGKPNAIQLTCHNRKKWFPVISLTIQMRGLIQGKEIQFETFLPALGKKEIVNKDILFTPLSRGLFELTGVRLGTGFPFGLLKKSWALLERASGPAVYVYPRTFDLFWEDIAPFLTEKNFDTPTDKRGDGTTLLGVREFIPGDNPKRIHWKSSAKRGGELWFVREMEEERQTGVHLEWPSKERFKEMSDEHAEELICFTASLIRSLDQRGIQNKFLNFIDTKPKMEFLAVVVPREYDFQRPMEKEEDEFIPIDVFEVYQQWSKNRFQHSS